MSKINILFKLFSVGSIRAASLLIGIGLMLYVNHFISIEYYGEYSRNFSFINITGFLAKLGFDILIIREYSKRNIYNKILPLFNKLFIIILMISIFLNSVNIISGIIYSAIIVYSEVLKRNGKTNLYVLILFIIPITMQLVLIILFNDIYDNRYLLLCSYIVALLLIIIVQFKLVVSTIKYSLQTKLLSSIHILKESAYGFAFGVANLSKNHIPIYVLSLLTPLEIVGIYSSLQRVVNGIGLPYQILNINNASKFVGYKNDIPKLNEYLKVQKVFFFYFGFLFPFILLLPFLPVNEVLSIDLNYYKFSTSLLTILVITKSLNGLMGPTQNISKIYMPLKKIVAIQILIYSSIVALYIIAYQTLSVSPSYLMAFAQLFGLFTFDLVLFSMLLRTKKINTLSISPV
jgi:O-antigen/teichoic acid export membrane protein